MSRDGRTEVRDRVAEQTSEIGRAEVRTAEREAGDVPQHAGRRVVHVRPGHRAGEVRLLAPVEVLRVDLLEHDVLRAVGCDSDDPVRDDAGDPDVPFRVERETVGERALAERRHDFLRPERAAGVNREPRQPPPERLVHVEPVSVGIHDRLVRVAETVGDDPCTAVVGEHDETRRAVGAEVEDAGGFRRADGDPHALRGVDPHEVGRGQRDAVHRLEERPHFARPREREDAAQRVAQVCEQKRAVAAERDAVRAQRSPPGKRRRVKRVRTVRPDVSHPTAPVGRVEIAARGGENALRPVESGADEAELVERDAGRDGGHGRDVGGCDVRGNVYVKSNRVARRTAARLALRRAARPGWRGRGPRTRAPRPPRGTSAGSRPGAATRRTRCRPA